MFFALGMAMYAGEAETNKQTKKLPDTRDKKLTATYTFKLIAILQY